VNVCACFPIDDIALICCLSITLPIRSIVFDFILKQKEQTTQYRRESVMIKRVSTTNTPLREEAHSPFSDAEEDGEYDDYYQFDGKQMMHEEGESMMSLPSRESAMHQEWCEMMGIGNWKALFRPGRPLPLNTPSQKWTLAFESRWEEKKRAWMKLYCSNHRYTQKLERNSEDNEGEKEGGDRNASATKTLWTVSGAGALFAEEKRQKKEEESLRPSSSTAPLSDTEISNIAFNTAEQQQQQQRGPVSSFLSVGWRRRRTEIPPPPPPPSLSLSDKRLFPSLSLHTSSSTMEAEIGREKETDTGRDRSSFPTLSKNEMQRPRPHFLPRFATDPSSRERKRSSPPPPPPPPPYLSDSRKTSNHYHFLSPPSLEEEEEEEMEYRRGDRQNFSSSSPISDNVPPSYHRSMLISSRNKKDASVDKISTTSLERRRDEKEMEEEDNDGFIPVGRHRRRNHPHSSSYSDRGSGNGGGNSNSNIAPHGFLKKERGAGTDTAMEKENEKRLRENNPKKKSILFSSSRSNSAISRSSSSSSSFPLVNEKREQDADFLNDSRRSSPPSLLERERPKGSSATAKQNSHNRLCIYLHSHSHSECPFIHSLRDYRPPSCRFSSTCSRKHLSCNFFHPETESKVQFIQRQIEHNHSSFFSVHKDKLRTLYHIHTTN